MPTVQTNGIQLYYEQLGKGTPLICIMGITAPGSVWEAHVDCWQRHFRCIVVDNRGVGQSDMPSGPYTSEMMAADYAGLMDALQIQQAHVVGCSMGSTIVQQLAINYPQKVRSAVMMCSWARCDRYAAGIFEHLKHIKARLTPSEFMNYIQLLIFAKPYWDKDESFKQLREAREVAEQATLPQPLHALEAQADACIHHDVLNRLHQVACPTLVIGGRQDIFTPQWMADEVIARIPRCEHHFYDDAGHAFHWECIDDFNPRVVRWLTSH